MSDIEDLKDAIIETKEELVEAIDVLRSSLSDLDFEGAEINIGVEPIVRRFDTLIAHVVAIASLRPVPADLSRLEAAMAALAGALTPDGSLRVQTSEAVHLAVDVDPAAVSAAIVAGIEPMLARLAHPAVSFTPPGASNEDVLRHLSERFGKIEALVDGLDTTFQAGITFLAEHTARHGKRTTDIIAENIALHAVPERPSWGWRFVWLAGLSFFAGAILNQTGTGGRLMDLFMGLVR